MYDQSLLSECNDDLAPAFVRAEEVIVSKFRHHVLQFSNMRNFVKKLIDISKEHTMNDVPWKERVIVEIADFAQNLDLPHFGSEQPGDTYYYSPLRIYLFGIVSSYKRKDSLLCQYFTEGEGAKGGNNVASMLWNNFKINDFINISSTQGPLGEYYMVMDNCGGQNKNRMVIRFFLMMCELQILKKAGNLYLVRGHTKKSLRSYVHAVEAVLSS